MSQDKTAAIHRADTPADDGTTDYCYSAECQYRLKHVCGRREPASDTPPTPEAGAPPKQKPTAAEVLGLLVVHLLQEHWAEAREIASEIRIDFATNPARVVAIDFVSTHEAEVADAHQSLNAADVGQAPTTEYLRNGLSPLAWRISVLTEISLPSWKVKNESLMAEVKKLREALSNLVCRNCENRIGFNDWPTQYGDWKRCHACAAARAVLQPKRNKP